MVLVFIFARVQESGAKREVRGKPPEVARELVREGRLDEVVALVDALAKRNSQLELLLTSLRAGRNKSESVSKEQLALALEELAALGKEGNLDEALKKANEELEKTTNESGGRPAPNKPPPQPPVRRAPPAGLRKRCTDPVLGGAPSAA